MLVKNENYYPRYVPNCGNLNLFLSKLLGTDNW